MARAFRTRLAASASTVIQGKLKLARLCEMSEEDLGALARKLEGSDLFKRLRSAQVLSFSEFPQARFSARRFAGYGLRLSGGGLPELVDGDCDLVRLIRRVGQEKFEECFLRDKAASDADLVADCGISAAEVRQLRDFVNRTFIQAEFEGPPPTAPEKVFSTVAGITMDGEKPILEFFHREIWKSRYRVDGDRLAGLLRSLSSSEAEKTRAFLRQLEFLDQRKSTLYAALEKLLAIQADFLASGDPVRRKPLTQRSLAADLGVHPSVLNRLLSNKSIQLPWGLEAPMTVLLPSAKDINRDRLYAIASANGRMSDDGLRREMERVHGVKLSRRSIAQYRKELARSARGIRRLQGC